MKSFKSIITDTSPVNVKDYLHKSGFSATLIKKVKFGGIFVNGVNVTVRKMLNSGDVIEVFLPDRTSENIEALNFPLDILYEDDYILAVNKPINMPTHPSKGNSLPTLANGVMGKYDGNFVFRAITRLDRDTSGIVLIAKDSFSANKLSLSLKRGEFTKKYLCVIQGIPTKNEGVINAPIARENPDSIRRIVAEHGKSAITEYKVLKTFDNKSLCEINLLTGRTHQIRVHMSYIGHPLVNDFLYGTPSENTYFLHCYRISFPHPKTKETITIIAKREPTDL